MPCDASRSESTPRPPTGALVAVLILAVVLACDDDGGAAKPDEAPAPAADGVADSDRTPLPDLIVGLEAAWMQAYAALDGIGGEPWVADTDIQRALEAARAAIARRLSEARAEAGRAAGLPDESQRALLRRNLADRIAEARATTTDLRALRASWDAEAPLITRVHGLVRMRSEGLGALVEAGVRMPEVERRIRDDAEAFGQALRMWSGAMLMRLEAGANADLQPHVVALGSLRNLEIALDRGDPELARALTAVRAGRLAESRIAAALETREDADRLRARLDALRALPTPDLETLEARTAALQDLAAEL